MTYLSKPLWVLALMMAAGLSALIPPMASPDEITHIPRAYLISRGILMLQPLPSAGSIESRESKDATDLFSGGRVGGMVDQGLLDFVDIHLPLILHVDRRLSAEETNRRAQIRWSGVDGFRNMQGTGYYLPAIYGPQALGLALGRGLDLSVEHSYYLSRGLTLLACFAVLWLAFNWMPPNPWVVAILLLPMSVFQLLLPTLDGLTTSLSVLTMSLFLNAADRGRKLSAAASWYLALCIFLLATSKTHLLSLLALPFYLAWQRGSRRDFYLGCCVSVGAVGWTLLALLSTSDLRIDRHLTTTELLLHYAANPYSFVTVVFATVVDQFNFFQLSFIGFLGWLDTRLPAHFYPTLWTGLGLCALISASGSTLREDWHARSLLVGIALASVALIFLAMLVTWTPHPAVVVQGVQGRYFVVPMILLGYAASGFATQQSVLRRTLSAWLVAGFALCSLSALTMTLLSRYH